jgi:mono/diheme cytochrome c family protein
MYFQKILKFQKIHNTFRVFLTNHQMLMETLNILRRMTGILTLMTVTILLMLIAMLVMNFTQKSESFGCGVIEENYNSPALQLTETEIKGKELFDANCRQCHAVTEEVIVGPGLKGISERRDEQWLLAWIKNSQKVIKSGDAYANELLKKYGGAQMTIFESLKDEEIRAILSYVNSEKSSGIMP